MTMKKLLRYLSPFAPDQSGVVSAVFEYGGLTVICDAGGCTGNICGFDEPRWFTQRSALFSAALRDMDAILGRDKQLVAKIVDAATTIQPSFITIVGTPVPAVIGTDEQALRRMVEKATGIPCIALPATGTHYYDEGVAAAQLALFKRFAQDGVAPIPGCTGLLGATPLDLSSTSAEAEIQSLQESGWQQVHAYGMGGDLSAVANAGEAQVNFVISPAGMPAARYLQKRFGTPYLPFPSPVLPKFAAEEVAGKRVLVVHQQFTANALRDKLLANGAAAVTVGSWFKVDAEFAQDEDLHFGGEEEFAAAVEAGGYELIIGDIHLRHALPGYAGKWIDFKHFALSGNLR